MIAQTQSESYKAAFEKALAIHAAREEGWTWDEVAELSGADLIGANLPHGMRIMQVMGSRGYLVALSTPDGLEVRSGCAHHIIAWWHADGVALGLSEGYTPGQIAEYRRHFAYIEEWHQIGRES